MTAPAAPALFRRFNPWVLAFVTGVLVLTLSRDRTRRVVEPPPRMGAVPVALFKRADGSPLPAGLTLVGFVPKGAVGKAILEGLASAAATFKKAEMAATVVAVPVAGGEVGAAALPATEGVLLAGSDPAAVSAFQAALRPLLHAPLPPSAEPWRIGVVMVDAQGQCRGVYRHDEDGVDEILHRTRHVLEEPP